LCAPSAHAQNQTVITFGFGPWQPGTEVQIVNDTDDGSEIQISPKRKDGQEFLTKGDQWDNYYSASVNADVVIMIKGCESVKSNQRVIYTPPSWSLDENFLGATAFTAAYLMSRPSMTDVREHINEIKRYLDKHDRGGKKERGKALDAWYKFIDKHDLEEPDATICKDPKVIATRFRVYWNGDYIHHVAVTIIRGNYATGYRIDGPKDRWY
jgi:hypothetical protein